MLTWKPSTTRYELLNFPAPQQLHVSPPKVVTPSPQVPGSSLPCEGHSHSATCVQTLHSVEFSGLLSLAQSVPRYGRPPHQPERRRTAETGTGSFSVAVVETTICS